MSTLHIRWESFLWLMFYWCFNLQLTYSSMYSIKLYFLNVFQVFLFQVSNSPLTNAFALSIRVLFWLLLYAPSLISGPLVGPRASIVPWGRLSQGSLRLCGYFFMWAAGCWELGRKATSRIVNPASSLIKDSEISIQGFGPHSQSLTSNTCSSSHSFSCDQKNRSFGSASVSSSPTPSSVLSSTGLISPNNLLSYHSIIPWYVAGCRPLCFSCSRPSTQITYYHTTPLFHDMWLAVDPFVSHALDLLSVLGNRNWTWFQGWYSTLSIVLKFSTPYLGGAGSTPEILHAESPNHCSALNLLTKCWKGVNPDDW